MEAILEVRFVTNHNWLLLSGLLYSQISDRYSEPDNLPLASLPEEIRKNEEHLTYLPLVSFEGRAFNIRLGPRVLSLTSRGPYPGWSRIREEIQWLLQKLEKASFVTEGERLGLRYIDFFEGDIFSNLVIKAHCASEPIEGVETSITTAFEKKDFKARLILNNSVFVEMADGPKSGSVLDLDLSLSAAEFDLFTNGLDRFDDANRVNKEIFFGLLEPEFLSTLSPKYD